MILITYQSKSTKMNNRKNLSKFKPHLFESFVVYAIVFFVLGSLKIFASNFLDKYSYVITAITIAVIAIVIWVLTKRKEKVKINESNLSTKQKKK